MRVASLMCFVFFVSISCNILNAQEISRSDPLYRNVKSKLFVPLFRALKTGNVDAIKKYISEDMHEKNKILLEQNEEYPNFLRNFYRGALFQVKKVIKSEEIIYVDVMVSFPGGYQNVAKYQLKEEKTKEGKDIWKVINLINDSY